MSLVELADSRGTDKNSTHSYLPIYDDLFRDKKLLVKNVLEVGICTGGSIKLWNDYFINANVVGIDICTVESLIMNCNLFGYNNILNNDKNKLYLLTDAYSSSMIDTLESTYGKFDMILDDGSHKLEDMKFFIINYCKLLTDTGIMIVEDIQDEKWIDILKDCVPEELKSYVDIYDLRDVKGRNDDILLVINKNKKID